MKDSSNPQQKVVQKLPGNKLWFYLVIVIAVALLGREINKFWLMYKNNSCLASVYTDKVRNVLRLSALRNESEASYKVISVLSKHKIDEDKNICETILLWDKERITVRYQPDNHASTLSAGRVNETTVYYGVDILDIEISENL